MSPFEEYLILHKFVYSEKPIRKGMTKENFHNFFNAFEDWDGIMVLFNAITETDYYIGNPEVLDEARQAIPDIIPTYSALLNAVIEINQHANNNS